jgi:hypothetical protein
VSTQVTRVTDLRADPGADFDRIRSADRVRYYRIPSMSSLIGRSMLLFIVAAFLLSRAHGRGLRPS